MLEKYVDARHSLPPERLFPGPSPAMSLGSGAQVRGRVEIGMPLV
jgi:hypothetical protein